MVKNKWRKWHTIETKLLLEPLKYVMKAVSKDKARPHLEGVLWERDCLVATDGYRLHISKIYLGAFLRAGSNFVLPFQQCEGLIKILKKGEKISIRRSDTCIEVEVNDKKTILDLSEYDFPKYRHTISQKSWQILLNPKELFTSSKIVKSCIEDKPKCAEIEIEDAFKMLYKKDGESIPYIESVIQYKDKLDLKRVELIQEGGNVKFGINLSYLLDAISSKRFKTVAIEYEGPLDSVIVAQDNKRYVAVIMPTRI